MPLADRERDRFDALLEEALGELPDALHDLLDEVPLIVVDEPDDNMLRDLGLDPRDPASRTELCGLHTGIPDTERGVDAPPELPGDIHLFRRGIIEQAGGWGRVDWDDRPGDDRVYEEIMITLLHEIGHQFGLDEDDLDRLGYA
ncbi:MAG: metallopeptidase family protein [Phycisphaeraceae bacterium]|nr:MAG: metallopeptidase family protein [Phycisphaeraceae bacterium]